MMQGNFVLSAKADEFSLPQRSGRYVQGADPSVLTEVYSEKTNIVVWQREVSAELEGSVREFVVRNSAFKIAMTLSPQGALAKVRKALGVSADLVLGENIADLVDMFCYLFALKRAGLRLTVLEQPMCPRFHVDNVPCRLVTTYQGVATQWLPHDLVDRGKLGPGSQGQPDKKSGLYKSEHDIRELDCGDVALFKGERWEGNLNAGLVHRSPEIFAGQSRLVLTLDFSN